MPINNPPNWSFDRAFAFGLPRVITEVRDSVAAPPAVRAMRELGAWDAENTGGIVIRRPIRHTSLNVQVVPDNPLSVTQASDKTDIISAATYEWGMLWTELVIDERDMYALSNTPDLAVNFIREHAVAAVRDFYRQLDTALFGTGTGTKTSIGGLGYYLDGGNTGSFGGIAKSNSFWQAPQFTTVGAISIDKLDSHIVSLSADYEVPRLVLSSPVIISKIRSLLQAGERVVNMGGQDQQFGALAIEYAGALLVADSRCPAGTIFYVNTDSIKWFVDKNEPSVKQVPDSRPVRKYSVAMFAQLTAAAVKDCARATGVTA